MFGGKQFRLPAVSKIFPKAHIEVAKSALNAWKYCGKDDTRIEGPLEYGQPPAQLNKRGEKGERNTMLVSKGAEQAVRDGDIAIEQYPKLKHAIDLFNAVTSRTSDLETLDNYWLCGPPGTGKSHRARADYPEYYDKPLNKWWDDYKSQPTVILDDFGIEQKYLVTHLKRWADKYTFTAETKGGAIKARP